MPARYQVCCVQLSSSFNHHRRISGLGGINPDGSRWKITEEAAILGIEAGRWLFYVSRSGQDVDLIVATSKYGSKYIKTAADRTLHPDGLLALPECR